MMPAETSLRVGDEIEYCFIEIKIAVVVRYVLVIDLRRYNNKHSKYKRYKKSHKTLSGIFTWRALSQRHVCAGA